MFILLTNELRDLDIHKDSFAFTSSSDYFQGAQILERSDKLCSPALDSIILCLVNSICHLFLKLILHLFNAVFISFHSFSFQPKKTCHLLCHVHVLQGCKRLHCTAHLHTQHPKHSFKNNNGFESRAYTYIQYIVIFCFIFLCCLFFFLFF